jgi:peroxin-12
MAESGAHVSSAASDDNNRPSIFEVLAQESLLSTLKPALHHILRVFINWASATQQAFFMFSTEHSG